MMSPLEKLKGDVDVLIPGDPNLALEIKGLLVEAFDEGARQAQALNDDTEELDSFVQRLNDELEKQA